MITRIGDCQRRGFALPEIIASCRLAKLGEINESLDTI
jgi:hypothetical protein